jgi:NADP-dependent 3-hydroxy acid dehydrogenase YdfG
MDLLDKTAVVTGGASGIGYALAERSRLGRPGGFPVDQFDRRDGYSSPDLRAVT